MNTLLAVLILSLMLLALAIDVAAVVGWARRTWR